MAGGNKKSNASIPKVKTGPSTKFRPPIETGRASHTGTKPLPEPSSVQQILVMMIVHLSRKIMYSIEISHRVGLYIFGTFILSVISDIWGESRSYLSRKDNIFNMYFAKYCWPWTMLVLGAFVFVSSYTTSCGRNPLIKSNLLRLVTATSAWYGFTGLFLMIEDTSGVCNATKFLNKAQCKDAGYEWKGLDISGHCFVLVLCNLLMLEEAKSYLGWERIKDMLRIEEHKRLSVEIPGENGNEESTVLSRLTPEEFLHLRSNYKKHTITVRVLFCLLSLLFVLWDLMIVCTVLYFHLMIEKVIASCLAVVTWFILYRVVYIQKWSPGLPGENGPFKYVTFQSKSYKYIQKRRESFRNNPEGKGERWGKKEDVPKFMGMPLYALNPQNKSAIPDPKTDDSGSQANISNSTYGKPLRSRSRSSSRIRLFDSKSSLNLRGSTFF